MHKPVLCDETIRELDIQPSDVVFEGTLGYGGHAQHIIPHCQRYIGVDQDKDAIAYCQDKFQHHDHITLVHDNFKHITTILDQLNCKKVDKILIDIGLSSVQLDHKQRGFSFQHNAPLDMRMDQTTQQTAADILNTYSIERLSEIFQNHAGIRNPKFMQRISETRDSTPYECTSQLITTIKKSFFFNNRRSQFINTMQRIFQALRIEVNQELLALEQFLDHAIHCLNPGGRIAIITFHSGEDKRVKSFFHHQPAFKMTTKKIIKPTQAEIKQNSRAKCAKLRVYVS